MAFVKPGQVNIVSNDEDMERGMDSNDNDGGDPEEENEMQMEHIGVGGVTAIKEQETAQLVVANLLQESQDEEKQRVDIVYDPLRVSLDHLIKVLQEVMLDASISKQNKRLLDSIGALEKSKPKRSSLHVDGICCASEVPQVTSILRQLSKSGVVKVSINITSRLVYVDHHPDEISAVDLARALNKDKFGATVRRDGGARQRIKTIPKALNISNSLNGSIRHIAPNVASRTIKVEHNPKLVSADSAFMDYGGCENGTVSVDGNIEGLFLQNTMNPDMSEVQSKKWRFAKRLKHFLPKGLGINIILSGIFWFVSLLGHFIEKWSYLQYAGLISVAFGIPPVALKAFRTLKRKHFDANCMMVTAAIGSLLLQEYDEAASV
eukprot:scaffold417_cov245-Chaetoceros_neogracile.AAC.5